MILASQSCTRTGPNSQPSTCSLGDFFLHSTKVKDDPTNFHSTYRSLRSDTHEISKRECTFLQTKRHRHAVKRFMILLMLPTPQNQVPPCWPKRKFFLRSTPICPFFHEKGSCEETGCRATCKTYLCWLCLRLVWSVHTPKSPNQHGLHTWGG